MNRIKGNDSDSSMREKKEHMTMLQLNANVKIIPNLIWTYLVSMNETRRLCLNSWKYQNPNTQIIILNPNNIYEYVEYNSSNAENLESEQKAYDFLPFYLLQKYGGIWMTPSTICTRSLNWVHEKKGKDFIGFYMGDLNTNKNPILENWFMASPAHSKLMFEVMEELDRSKQFPDISTYIKSIREEGLNIQEIPYPEFLKLHLVFQRVIQSTLFNSTTYSIELIDATQGNGPLSYLKENNWNSTFALKRLCGQKFMINYPLIQLREKEMNLLEDGEANVDCFAVPQAVKVWIE